MQDSSVSARKRPLVLIVDDDRQIVQGLEIRLKAQKYDVAIARDGAQGLEKAIECRPDAIVLDVRMPNVDGLEMLEAIRKQDAIRELPAIVVSANIAERVRMRAVDLDAAYFLQKPYSAEQLVRAVNSVVKPPTVIEEEKSCA